MWVESSVRDQIVSEVDRIKSLTGFSYQSLLKFFGIQRSKFSSWRTRYGEPNRHNSALFRKNQILPEEYKAIMKYAKRSESRSMLYHINGYRRLTYMMLDEDIAFVSPSTTYRVLKEENLLNRCQVKKNKRGDGYKHPMAPHKEWHIDIKYVNFRGTFLFFLT